MPGRTPAATTSVTSVTLMLVRISSEISSVSPAAMAAPTVPTKLAVDLAQPLPHQAARPSSVGTSPANGRCSSMVLPASTPAPRPPRPGCG